MFGGGISTDFLHVDLIWLQEEHGKVRSWQASASAVKYSPSKAAAALAQCLASSESIADFSQIYHTPSGSEALTAISGELYWTKFVATLQGRRITEICAPISDRCTAATVGAQLWQSVRLYFLFFFTLTLARVYLNTVAHCGLHRSGDVL